MIAVRDSLIALSVDLRQISSYSVLPGSIVVGLVGSGSVIAQIVSLAAADKIAVTYEGVVYRLLKRTSTTLKPTGDSQASSGLCVFCIDIVDVLTLLKVQLRRAQQLVALSEASCSLRLS